MISDTHTSLTAAISSVFVATWQRRRAHWMRSIMTELLIDPFEKLCCGYNIKARSCGRQRRKMCQDLDARLNGQIVQLSAAL